MRLAFAIALAAVLAAPATAVAATWSVEMWGRDVAGCGKKKAPCRTISHVLSLAGPGDTILVGPGHYGNTNRDNGFVEPAEETGAQVDTGCNCMLPLDQPVRLLSTHGAAMTVLDAGGDTGPSVGPTSLVTIAGPGVRLGARGRGFTLTNGFWGVELTPAARGAVVEGNIALRNEASGFFANGDFGHRFTLNTAIDNSAGFGQQFSTGETGGSLWEDNVAVMNRGSGFSSGSSVTFDGNLASSNGGHGFRLIGTGTTARNCVANANERSGFNLQRDVVMENIRSIGNEGPGILIGQPQQLAFRRVEGTITRAELLGNQEAGILVLPMVTAVPTLRDSALFGNDRETDFPLNDLSSLCDLDNRSGFLNSFDASENYWGRPDGPGAGQVCDTGFTPITTPFLAKSPKIKIKRRSPL